MKGIVWPQLLQRVQQDTVNLRAGSAAKARQLAGRFFSMGLIGIAKKHGGKENIERCILPGQVIINQPLPVALLIQQKVAGKGVALKDRGGQAAIERQQLGAVVLK